MVIEQAMRARAAMTRDDPHTYCALSNNTFETWLLLHVDICGAEDTEAKLQAALAKVQTLKAA